MQRVDLDPGGTAQKCLEPPAGGKVHPMSEPVALGPRLGLVGAMVPPARQLVHMLVQRAAQRHVELLQPAADREQRRAFSYGAADQRQRGGVPVGIGKVALPRRRAAIECRIDIGQAAGDEDSVQPAEKRFRVETGAQGRDQDRDRLRTGNHRIDIFLADAVKVQLVAGLETGGDADQGHEKALGHGSDP
jgi:glutamine synthetase